jgi:hypothetical protein
MTADEGFRYAAEHAPGGLYKYRHFESDKDRERVKRALQFGEVYFSSRLELNDPFELQLAFSLNPDRKKVIKGLVKGAQRAGKERGATIKEIRQMQDHLRNVDPLVIMENVQRAHNERMESGCFVFCMCAAQDDPVLWAHYADSHKGLCIGFDTRAHPFLGATAIDYSEHYPTTPFPRIVGEEDSLFRKSALSKSLHWKYEKEFRLCSVRMGDNPTWHLDLPWQGQLARVNPRTINRVYIGARMPQPRREELLNFCRRVRPDIKVYAGAASAERYELKFTELS